MMRRHGFTLIELLVVIAIIAILAAILFPVFARARESARSSTCISNLNQIGKAFAQYIQDYGQIMPAGCNLVDKTPAQGGVVGICRDGWPIVHPFVLTTAPWPGANCRQVAPNRWECDGQLDPYIKNRDIWKDPSDKGDVSPYNPMFGNTRINNFYQQFGSSYYYIWWPHLHVFREVQVTQIAMGANAEVHEPARVPIYVDGGFSPTTAQARNDYNENPRTYQRMPERWHMDDRSINVLFGDLHSKVMRIDEYLNIRGCPTCGLYIWNAS